MEILKPPIILLGNTRSGTSIVQTLMSEHQDIVGWYEPSEMWLYADPGRSHDEFDEHDATHSVVHYIRKKFLKYQQRNGDRVIFEKTPKNILKIPYVHAIFPEATYLYLVRDPFSFISSVEFKWQRPVTKNGIIRRLKSTPLSQVHHHLGSFLLQLYNKRILRRKYLSIWGPRYKGIHEDLKTLPLLTVIARQWSIGSRKAEQDLALFDEGQVLRLRYEDFVERPIDHLERICSHCGYELTGRMVEAAKTLVKSDRQQKWQRFNPVDLAQILPEIKVEMKRHGYEIPAEIIEAIGKTQDLQTVGPAYLEQKKTIKQFS